MFKMTCDITLGAFNVKPNAIAWETGVDNFSDTAEIKVPASTYLKKQGDVYDRVPTALSLTEGMPVEIKAGYDGDNQTRFKGFLRRINYTVPLTLECEGYAYQLRQVLDFTRSYKNTTVRKILEDVTAGTAIRLSDAIPQIPIDKATFKNVTGIQVLEWLKEKCLLTVHFNLDVLYAGALELDPANEAVFQLGWNVVKDNDLKFNNNKEYSEVKITIESRAKSGQRNQEFDGNVNGKTKILRTAIRDAATQRDIAREKRKQYVNQGYEGSITAFLMPYVKPGDTAVIQDSKYPERKGKYFILGVRGTFDTSGGRQKIKIGNKLSA